MAEQQNDIAQMKLMIEQIIQQLASQNEAQAQQQNNAEAQAYQQLSDRNAIAQLEYQNTQLANEIAQMKLDRPPSPVRTPSQSQASFRLDYKLVPTFSGKIDDEYLLNDFKFDCSQYLDSFPDLLETSKLTFATQRLRGRAHSWYKNQITIQKTVFRSLDSLFDSLDTWFNASLPPNEDRNRLFEIIQVGSVTDFTEEFNQILLRLQISDDEACDRYLRKLKPQIKSRVQSISLIWKDLNLLQAAAISQETIYQTSRQGRVSTITNQSRTGQNQFFTPPTTSEISKNFDPKNSFQKTTPMDFDNSVIAWITYAERQFLLANNGCLRC